MIKVTKMGGEELTINADLIESIQSTPDTVITLTNGKKILVRDEEDEVVKKVIKYKREIFSCLTVEKG